MSGYAMKGRFAGLVYLGVVATGIFTLAYAPSQLSAPDAASTLANIASNEALFRASIASGVAMNVFFLMLPVVLFQLLEREGRILSMLMVLFAAASVPIWLIAQENLLAISSDVFAGAGATSADAIQARLDAYGRGMSMASVFWGLWLAPLGILILKSGAIPRLLGALLILGCLGYLTNFFGPLLFAGFEELPFREHIRKPGSLGEIGTCLWLLIMGAREPRR